MGAEQQVVYGVTEAVGYRPTNKLEIELGPSEVRITAIWGV